MTDSEVDYSATIQRLLQTIAQGLEAPTEPPAPPVPEEPAYLRGIERRLKVIDRPVLVGREDAASVEEARAVIRGAIASYLAQEAPGRALLVKALPGVGKTTAAVGAAEALALEGRRVLYAGPRHDFYPDLMAIAAQPSWWYEWLPRQRADEAAGKPETCQYADQIQSWMVRGYAAMDFCSRICGWDFIKEGCPWHAQKRRPEPIIYGQHQHIALGHPISFEAVIGDESPLAAFCRKWSIPGKYILPSGMDPTVPLAEVLHNLEALAEHGGKPLEGEQLLQLLGGASHVAEACEQMMLPASALAVVPEIYKPAQVSEVPYFHLPSLVPLLLREARMAAEGKEYLHRVILAQGRLIMLLRRPVNDRLPDHICWLDATANPTLYEAVLGRKCQVVDVQPRMQAHIFQVYDRANGKASLQTEEGDATPKAAQLELQVQRIVERRGYRAAAIITFQGTLGRSPYFQGLAHTHFYAARGTNALEDCDALVVAGTPVPPLSSLTALARMVFFERIEPWKQGWATVDRPYNYIDPDGKGASYPVSGFPGDPQLDAVLWAVREAEIIQAAHRVRPVNHEVDIWLLTNLPIDELPPERLLSIADVFGAPAGVDVFDWPRVVPTALRIVEEKGQVTALDLAQALGRSANTARKYWQILRDEYGWEVVEALRPPGRRGRPNGGALIPGEGVG